MVTGHLKTGKNEERKQEERLLSLGAFILNPKNLDVLEHFLMLEKRHLRAALSALQLIQESQGRIKKNRTTEQFVLRCMPCLEVG